MYVSAEWQAKEIHHSHNLRIYPQPLSHKLTYILYTRRFETFNWSPWWSLLAVVRLSISELWKLYMASHSNTETNTHKSEVGYLPSILLAGKMLYFSLTCYIKSNVSMPDTNDANDHCPQTQTLNEITIPDLILISVSISHDKTTHFHFQFSVYVLCRLLFGLVANTVWQENDYHMCLGLIDGYIDKIWLRYILCHVYHQ